MWRFHAMNPASTFMIRLLKRMWNFHIYTNYVAPKRYIKALSDILCSFIENIQHWKMCFLYSRGFNERVPYGRRRLQRGTSRITSESAGAIGGLSHISRCSSGQHELWIHQPEASQLIYVTKWNKEHCSAMVERKHWWFNKHQFDKQQQ